MGGRPGSSPCERSEGPRGPRRRPPPEPKTVKNRVHLDLRVGPERRAEEVARLEAL
ncbi:VOC family protein, partial [Nocardiopsis alba]|uniref:VOC family protein n=1 Tax=Nocardiopsis alba TaxID=53437 RepID=UPI003F4D1C2A